MSDSAGRRTECIFPEVASPILSQAWPPGHSGTCKSSDSSSCLLDKSGAEHHCICVSPALQAATHMATAQGDLQHAGYESSVVWVFFQTFSARCEYKCVCPVLSYQQLLMLQCPARNTGNPFHRIFNLFEQKLYETRRSAAS